MRVLPVVLALTLSAAASPLVNSTSPKVSISLATVTGVSTGTVSKFLGIPFAKAPRFRHAQPINAYLGSVSATSYGVACPQQALGAVSGANVAAREIVGRHMKRAANEEGEDCLSLNIITPPNVKSNAKLPVLVWIYGGGFQVGDAANADAMGTRVVERSIATGQPVIFVSINYRVSAFGFLASKEVKAAKLGNIGLEDQRVGLQWVQRYIGNFGGNNKKVTLWGQSAGAMSIAFQMLYNNGKNSGLFHGAFMQSGAHVPAGDITNGQRYYDQIVEDVGCSKARDTLQCLRTVPLASLRAAVDKTPNYDSHHGLALAWLPRVDGCWITEAPHKQLDAGRFVRIPVVTGNVDDEGTYFSLAQTDISTDADFRAWVKKNWTPAATDEELEDLWRLYPDEVAAGSPFDTGANNAIYGQYKRIAAFQGDTAFQAPRRAFLQAVSQHQNAWSYLSKVLKNYSVLGAFHSSDMEVGFMEEFVINFTNKGDPSTEAGPWPTYTNAQPIMLSLDENGAPGATLDTYRAEGMTYLTNLTKKHQL
ncbi:carotenoid ester lipase precursor [Panaeolus papilionaceus]|nr:carotenoid ester lipase precursor [Panaeolus papilionaceus]